MPTKRGTGLLVLGDYYDLQKLYATVHKLVDRAEKAQPLHNGLLLGFAYELRKAYDGKRLTHHDSATGITYSGRGPLRPALPHRAALQSPQAVSPRGDTL